MGCARVIIAVTVRGRGFPKVAVPVTPPPTVNKITPILLASLGRTGGKMMMQHSTNFLTKLEIYRGQEAIGT